MTYLMSSLFINFYVYFLYEISECLYLRAGAPAAGGRATIEPLRAEWFSTHSDYCRARFGVQAEALPGFE